MRMKASMICHIQVMLFPLKNLKEGYCPPGAISHVSYIQKKYEAIYNIDVRDTFYFFVIYQ